MIERFQLGELPAQWDHLKEKEEMALVYKKPGTEQPRPLVWEPCFNGTMFAASHHKGIRMEFFVTLRKRGEPDEHWELGAGNNDGTGSPTLHKGKTAEECMKVAQDIVNRGE